MQNKNFISRLAGLSPHFDIKLTRTKLLLFALTLIVFGIALGGLESGTDQTTVADKVIKLNLPERQGYQVSPGDDITALPDAAIGTGTSAQAEQWDRVIIQPGQSLDVIFREQGFSAKTLHEIMALSKETKQLKKIRPGDVFEFQRHDDNTLKRMRYAVDEARYLIVEHDGQHATSSTDARDMIAEMTEASGTITSSLFLAGKQAGLSDAMVMQLANLFGWDIDFVLDIRKGDQFHLLYEKIYRDGNFLRDGEIVGATFVNQARNFRRFGSKSMARPSTLPLTGAICAKHSCVPR